MAVARVLSIGLDQVVVRAGLQAKDPSSSVPRAVTDFQAVEIGQFKTEQHQVGAVIRFQRVCSCIDTASIVSVSPQAVATGFCCGSIAFYHEYTQDGS